MEIEVKDYQNEAYQKLINQLRKELVRAKIIICQSGYYSEYQKLKKEKEKSRQISQVENLNKIFLEEDSRVLLEKATIESELRIDSKNKKRINYRSLKNSKLKLLVSIFLFLSSLIFTSTLLSNSRSISLFESRSILETVQYIGFVGDAYSIKIQGIFGDLFYASREEGSLIIRFGIFDSLMFLSLFTVAFLKIRKYLNNQKKDRFQRDIIPVIYEAIEAEEILAEIDNYLDK